MSMPPRPSFTAYLRRVAVRRVALALTLAPGLARPEGATSAVPVVVEAPAALVLSVQDAVLMALEHNRGLRVARLAPVAARAAEKLEQAAFDAQLDARLASGRERAGAFTNVLDDQDALAGSATLAKTFPSGTGLTADFVTAQADAANGGGYLTRAGLTVSQALLQGLGAGPNLASLRQARLDTEISRFELRAFAEALVTEVEFGYWDYVLGIRQSAILEESLRLARQQADETRQRIRVGGLAETELAAALSEIAIREEALINSRSLVARRRVQLLRRVRPEALAQAGTELRPDGDPHAPAAPPDPLEQHVAVALRLRPDLNQARLLLERGELELVKTRNGLLPRLDLFARLGRTGYAASFGDSAGELGGEAGEWSAGAVFSRALGNRAPRAAHERAQIARDQLEEALRNAEDLVREDVAVAHLEVLRTRQQVDATATTRRFEEEKLRAETAKFRVGKSTALLVAQAQRDLLQSQVAEAAAVTANLEALTDLYRLDGSLLQRRGIAVADTPEG